MNKIKFSHYYEKMPEKRFPDKTYLIGVSRCNIMALPKAFTKYDTCYKAPGGVAHYPLPENGVFIVLTLFTGEFKCWTTIRRWTEEKESYYKHMIGQEVEIVMT